MYYATSPHKNQDKYPENAIKEPQQKQSLFGGFNYSSFALCILLWDCETQWTNCFGRCQGLNFGPPRPRRRDPGLDDKQTEVSESSFSWCTMSFHVFWIYMEKSCQHNKNCETYLLVIKTSGQQVNEGLEVATVFFLSRCCCQGCESRPWCKLSSKEFLLAPAVEILHSRFPLRAESMQMSRCGGTCQHQIWSKKGLVVLFIHTVP